jgi:glycosyltransferase involved in cell wall biosynthesis
VSRPPRCYYWTYVGFLFHPLCPKGRQRAFNHGEVERMARVRLSDLYAVYGSMTKFKKSVQILQIGNFPPPMCGWAIHTQAVQNALQRRGAACVVLDIGPGRRARKDESGYTPMRGAFDFLVKIFSFRLRGYTFEPHVNGDSWQGYLLALAAVLLGQFTGKPAILMFHAGPDQLYFPRKKGMWFLAFRVLFHASAVIVCNLESVKREIEKYGVPPEKVQAVFSVDYPTEEIPVPLPAAVEQFLRSHEPRLFSYTLFRQEFTPEVLFEAFARLCEEFPRAGLLIAGPREIPAEITAMIKHWGLESRVLISGNLAHSEFLTGIQRSDVFIRTHLRDGLCASVIEALSLGVPVVAVEDGIRPPSVITYYPPEAPVLLGTLTRVLKNLDEVRSQTQSTSGGGNLDAEVSLLLSVASGQSR